MHDRRSDVAYLELLELPSNSSPPPAEDWGSNVNWKEWESLLKQITADYRGEPRRGSCAKHSGKLVRIHKYMLED